LEEDLNLEYKREQKEKKRSRNILEHGKKVGCFLGRLGHRKGWKVRVLDKIRRFWGDSRHVDMRCHINLFGFFMGFSSSDEEVSTDIRFFF